jgi:hypothetical protein
MPAVCHATGPARQEISSLEQIQNHIGQYLDALEPDARQEIEARIVGLKNHIQPNRVPSGVRGDLACNRYAT